MPRNRWTRRVLLALIWAGAVSTWASIAHHFWGLPDVGPALVLVTAAVTLVIPTIRDYGLQRQAARRSTTRSHIAAKG
jgi:hypothetical protein